MDWLAIRWDNRVASVDIRRGVDRSGGATRVVVATRARPTGAREHDLSLLESVLARLERESFTAPRLRELQAAMSAGGLQASAQIAELRRLLHWYDSRRNPLFLPVAILRMWDIRYAFKLEAWRRARARRWHAGCARSARPKALSSLASHAFDNPADVFPIVEPGPIRITAIGIGHPLIASEKCVRNDVTLGGTTGSAC